MYNSYLSFIVGLQELVGSARLLSLALQKMWSLKFSFYKYYYKLVIIMRVTYALNYDHTALDSVRLSVSLQNEKHMYN